MATLTIFTINPSNEYNLVLTAFTNAVYTTLTQNRELNAITFYQVPTLTEIKSCLQTNINRMKELAQNAIRNGDEITFFDYIPDYIKELLSFIEGLFIKQLLNEESAKPYIKQLLNLTHKFTLGSKLTLS